MSDVNIGAILQNIKQVSISPSSMEILREFERVIDESGCYAFHHFKQLELVDGPEISAYRVKCTFMSPLKQMPDPSGMKRLTPYGIIVKYKKAWLKYPIKIKSEADFRSDIKKAKIAKTPVWLITIDMPKFLMKSITKGSKEILDKEMDLSDLEDGYESDLDTHAGIQQAGKEENQENESMGGGF